MCKWTKFQLQEHVLRRSYTLVATHTYSSSSTLLFWKVLRMSHYKEYGISLLKNVSYYVLMQCFSVLCCSWHPSDICLFSWHCRILSKELKFIIQVHIYVNNVTDWMNIKCKITVKLEGDILIQCTFKAWIHVVVSNQ